MKPAFSWLPVGAALLSGAFAADPAYSTIPVIEAYGQHFFYSNNGSQFFLKGVAYQQDYSPNGTSDSTVKYTDPLADGTSCARDIPYMKEIFTNVIRVYALDPTQDHDDCMEQLAAADIYVVADLSEPSTSIDSNDPSWDVTLYNRYTSVVTAMAKYNNVIGFFAGNEVIDAANSTAAAAFVKAAVRDTKSYIKANYRSTLGVGYATADVPSRDQLAAYFACEPDSSDSSIDFWGYNVYSWCGDSSYTTSSYNERVDFFSDYPVPVFFAEYGCIDGVVGGPLHRPFTEVPVLFGNMTEVFSGGIVYEWFMAANEYGLVNISGSSVIPNPDFTSLKSQLATVSPSSTQSSAYTPTNKALSCPSLSATFGTGSATGTWSVQPTALPPVVNPALCSCEAAAVSCGVATDDATTYGDVFDFICGSADGICDGISHNATTGEFGAISGCDPKEQLAFVANLYYSAHSKSSGACSFGGVATVQSAATASTCSSLIAAVGTAGTGTVPNPTGTQGGSASSSKGVAPGIHTPSAFFDIGKALFVAYALTAVISGVGMFVL
ncbi:beta-1-3-glucanosyltransferase-like protein [Xylariales sp. PMI_506]|nr:beta-1-3-glucanosyltransferase-like protein [Xylariales sp. PMI_506]